MADTISRRDILSGAAGFAAAATLPSTATADWRPTEAVRVAGNIRVLSIATLIGEAIARTAEERSVSSLFE